jgi:DNA adenine methylase
MLRSNFNRASQRDKRKFKRLAYRWPFLVLLLLPHQNSTKMQIEKGISKTYFGGKGASGAVQKIINIVPPIDTLIEPFLGNGYLTRTIKKPSKIIGNDLSSIVIQKWRNLNYSWLELHNMPAIKLLQNIDFSQLGRTAIYLDPPYPLDSRRSQQLVYDFEMTDSEHVELLNFIKYGLPKNIYVIISSYPNPIYERELFGWNRIEYQAKTRQGMATEVLYYNFSDLSQLHDYRFSGENYRERLQIKRKAKRWVNRLQLMPDYEKQAIFSEILKLPEFQAAAALQMALLPAGE